MKTILFKAADRGSADYGWLKPNYYFSLLNTTIPKSTFWITQALNDDFIAGGGAFPRIRMIIWRSLPSLLQVPSNIRTALGAKVLLKPGHTDHECGTGVQHSGSKCFCD
jgi:hypothetical protein